MSGKAFSSLAAASAHSGILLGEFSEMHELIEHVMGRPVWTHEMARSGLWEQIRGRLVAQLPALDALDIKAGEELVEGNRAAVFAALGERVDLFSPDPT